MNIDIQSLFRDILETPEQRQQRELAETTLRSREMTRNITSRYAAPFAGMVPGFLSNVNRATTGLGSALGLDMRSTSEKAQEALSGLNLTDPQSVQNTVQMLRGAGLGAQAAQILGMSAEAIQKQEKETTLFNQQVEINKLRARQLEQDISLASSQEERAQKELQLRSQTETLRQAVAAMDIDERNAARIADNSTRIAQEESRENIVSYLKGLGPSYQGFALLAQDAPSNQLSDIVSDALKFNLQQTKTAREQPEYKPLSAAEKTEVDSLATENDTIKEMMESSRGFLWLGLERFGAKDDAISQAGLYERVAVIRASNPELSTSEILDIIGYEYRLQSSPEVTGQVVRPEGQVSQEQLEAVSQALANQQSGQVSRSQ